MAGSCGEPGQSRRSKPESPHRGHRSTQPWRCHLKKTESPETGGCLIPRALAVPGIINEKLAVIMCEAYM